MEVADKYPWYGVVDGGQPLEQGDMVSACPVIDPRKLVLKPGEKVPADVDEYDVVVMSQSCDLSQKKVTLVLTCPVWRLAEFKKKSGFYAKDEGKKALKQGTSIGYHLLNQCDIEGHATDFLVVDFRNVYGVPFDSLVSLAKARGKRLRLLPPYREHLAQGFARFMMRVGLPVDMPDLP